MTKSSPAMIMTVRSYNWTCFWRWLQGVCFGIGLGIAIGTIIAKVYQQEVKWQPSQSTKQK